MERQISPLVLPDEFAQFAELEHESFGEGANTDVAMHEWLLRDNPDQPVDGTMMYIMREGDRMIAADGLVPQRVQVAGRTYLAAHSVKSMTHPDFKRQGIFTTMTLNSGEEAKAAGVDLIIGLANAASYPTYVKLGFHTIFTKTILLKPLRMTSWFRRRLKVGALAVAGNAAFRLATTAQRSDRALRGYEVTTSDTIPADAGALWDALHGRFDCLLVRDAQYLRYRYDERPDADYTSVLLRRDGAPVGLAVLRLAKTAASRVASVCEFFCDPTSDDDIRALAAAATRVADEHEADYLVAGLGEFGRFEAVLKGCGFRPGPEPRNNMMIARILNEEVTLADIDGHHRWHITQGDGETELDL